MVWGFGCWRVVGLSYEEVAEASALAVDTRSKAFGAKTLVRFGWAVAHLPMPLS